MAYGWEYWADLDYDRTLRAKAAEAYWSSIVGDARDPALLKLAFLLADAAGKHEVLLGATTHRAVSGVRHRKKVAKAASPESKDRMRSGARPGHDLGSSPTIERDAGTKVRAASKRTSGAGLENRTTCDETRTAKRLPGCGMGGSRGAEEPAITEAEIDAPDNTGPRPDTEWLEALSPAQLFEHVERRRLLLCRHWDLRRHAEPAWRYRTLTGSRRSWIAAGRLDEDSFVREFCGNNWLSRLTTACPRGASLTGGAATDSRYYSTRGRERRRTHLMTWSSRVG